MSYSPTANQFTDMKTAKKKKVREKFLLVMIKNRGGHTDLSPTGVRSVINTAMKSRRVYKKKESHVKFPLLASSSANKLQLIFL